MLGNYKPTETRFAREHPKAYLWLHAAVGLLLAIACVWAFLSIAEDLPEHGRMVHVDHRVTLWLQAHGTEWGESIFWTVSLFGSPILYTVLVAVAIGFIARRKWRHLAILVITCGGGWILNALLKLTFHRMRPEFAAEFSASGWSFPSGHAMDSLISYGLLTYWLRDRYRRWQTPILLGAMLLIALIGYSRIYLGVHYLSDVVAGYCAGGVWLAVCITGYQLAERDRIGKDSSDRGV